MNTEHLLGDFRLSINTYSPNILGCQEVKQNFFAETPAVHPAPGMLLTITGTGLRLIVERQWTMEIGWRPEDFESPIVSFG